MGCLNSKTISLDSSISNDDQQLLEEKITDSKYDFIAEYNTKIDCNVKYKEIVSRRPSVSISIAAMDELHGLHNLHKKEEEEEEEDKEQEEDEKKEKEKEKENDVFIKKYYKCDSWNSLSFGREAKILSTISHNNIISYITSYQDDIAYYLVIEYCNNGTLISYIYNKYIVNNRDNNYKYNELIIYDIISTLISILSYCHSLNIVHRNICLENIYILNGKYKLIGWDDAEIIDNKNDVYDDFVGSNIYYLSPETIQIRHGWELKKIDIFAVGVIAFILSFGTVPFTGYHQTNICKKIINLNYNWPKNWNNYISIKLRKFIITLLSPYPYSRISANDAKMSDFLISKPLIINDGLINDVPFKLHCYETAMKIRKLLIENKCDSWTKCQQNELIKIFEQIFNLQKEKISYYDLENLLIKMGLNKNESNKKTKQLFDIMDPKKTGHIKINSFIYHHQHQRINSNSINSFQYSPMLKVKNNNNNNHENEISLSQSSISELR